jgi:hypothetical protein
MSWLRLDDNLLDDPQWGQALLEGGSAALHLWLSLSLWSAKHFTDGEVPAHMLRAIPGPRGSKLIARAYRALIAASLLERLPDGSVRIVAHLERHPAREEVMERRRRWKDAQQKQRKGRKVIDGVNDDEGLLAELESFQRPPAPSRPVPIPTRRTMQSRSSSGPVVVVEPEGSPVVWRTLDGWGEPEGLEDEAFAAGVPREFYRSQLEQLRNTTIGGKGGVRDRTAYVRQQFGRWRAWAEAARARPANRRQDRPNQPNCGLTGLEGAEEVTL